VKKKILIIIFVLVGIAGTGWYYKQENKGKLNTAEPLYLALIGPMEGARSTTGLALRRGAQLAVDQWNRRGGIQGRLVQLHIYDDKNTPLIAAAQATKIINDGKALAVIAHHTSGNAIAGGKVYQKAEIPAITPGATNIEVTQGNDWFFRTIFNDRLQGKFLANYANKVYARKEVHIIQDRSKYGSYLADIFADTTTTLKGKIAHRFYFESKNQGKLQEFEKFIQQIAAESNGGVIFLATHGPDGAELVRIIREQGIRNPIVTPDSFSSRGFLAQMAKFPKEALSPGYYSNGIFVTSPILFDTGNEKAQEFYEDYFKQYQDEPSWPAAFAYDSALLLLNAMQEQKVQGTSLSLKEDRRKIRDFLRSLDSLEKGIEGVTGITYFDEEGNAIKPVTIGRFKNKNIISALTQLKTIQNLNEIGDMQEALELDRVLFIDNKYMYKTNIVYTGIKINEISEIDTKNLTYEVNFNIWFRFQGEQHPEDITFVNAVDKIYLDDPIEEKRRNNLTYRAYQVQAAFKIDFHTQDFSKGQYELGVKFRHRDLTRKNLIYVIDVLGMGLSPKASLLDKIIENQTLSPALGWFPTKARFAETIRKVESEGDLQYLNAPLGMLEFSQFNLGVLIKQNSLSLRRDLSPEYVLPVTLLCILGLFLLFLIQKKAKYSPGKIHWGLRGVTGTLLLLSGEVLALEFLGKKAPVFQYEIVIIVFDILWWIAPAHFLLLAIEQFVWIPLEKRTGRKLPDLVRRFLGFLVYTLTIFFVIAFVFDQKITSLLATSGVLAMIIGLAIQINISNIFSGIVINLERPFRIGDFVKIGDFDEGLVTDITWRTTRIESRSGSMLCIPNSRAAESVINNFSYPDDRYFFSNEVHVDAKHPPEKVQKVLLDAVLSVNEEIDLSWPPRVMFREVNEWAAVYKVIWLARDYQRKFLAHEAVEKRIWKHLQRAGIRNAVQRQEVYNFKGEDERGESIAEQSQSLLDEVDIFQPFSDQDKLYLSKEMRKRDKKEGEWIVKKGGKGDSMFIIIEGAVVIETETALGMRVEVARLGAGDFFGEMALMTGEVRTADVRALSATTFYEIEKQSIAPLLVRNPQIMRTLSNILYQRKMELESFESSVQEAIEQQESLKLQLLNSIGNFFGIELRN